jgi:hypothetical protein
MEKEILGQKCSTRSRCRDVRACDFCAARRQKQIAGVAESVEASYGQLTLTTIKPEQNTEEAIRALRASFMRRALAPAGIWTVETGSLFSGLHLNILSPKPLPAQWRKCETYSELVQTTARDAAAYISKRSGMPPVDQFRGRLFGAWGKVGEILLSEGVAPVVQAAAVELTLNGGSMGEADRLGAEYLRIADMVEGWREGEDKHGRKVWFSKSDGRMVRSDPHFDKPERTKEERAEMARRHLPNLYAAVRKDLTTV